MAKNIESITGMSICVTFIHIYAIAISAMCTQSLVTHLNNIQTYTTQAMS